MPWVEGGCPNAVRQTLTTRPLIQARPFYHNLAVCPHCVIAFQAHETLSRVVPDGPWHFPATAPNNRGSSLLFTHQLRAIGAPVVKTGQGINVKTKTSKPSEECPTFERVLDESLDRVKAGEPPEEVAARFPDFELELRLELQTAELLLAFFQADWAPGDLLRYRAKRRQKQFSRSGQA